MSMMKDVSTHPPRAERIEGYKRIVLIPMIEQMMFVAGETGEPTSETTTLIEQIVHEQVLELVGASSIDTARLRPNVWIAQSLNCFSYSTWLTLNHDCRSLLPDPSRQSQDCSPQDFSILEGCAQDRARL